MDAKDESYHVVTKKLQNVLYITDFFGFQIHFVMSPGSYTPTAGIPQIVQRVSEYIARRDGGVPCHPENIYISSGSQWALTVRKATQFTQPLPPAGYLVSTMCHSLGSLEHFEGLGEFWGLTQNCRANPSAMPLHYYSIPNGAGSGGGSLLPQRGAGLGAGGGGATASFGLCKGSLQPGCFVCHQPWKPSR